MNVKKLICSLAIFALPSVVFSAPINIYNTGVDNSNNLLAPGAQDTHYQVTVSPSGPGNAFAADNPPSGNLPGPWVPNGPDYQWISPVQGSIFAGPGNYSYETTFNLGPNAITTEAFLRGLWTVDNSLGRILLNGVEVAPANPGNTSAFTQLFPFDITQDLFLIGLNTLTFELVNIPPGDSPTGLIVQFTETSDGRGAEVPLPASVWLFSFGLLGLLRRQREISI